MRLPSAIERNRTSIIALCERYGVDALYLFGSAASPDWDERTSDLDFVVSFREQPALSIADRYLGLAEDLERLLGRPVDLITDRSIRNPFFRRNVDATRVPLYAA